MNIRSLYSIAVMLIILAIAASGSQPISENQTSNAVSVESIKQSMMSAVDNITFYRYLDVVENNITITNGSISNRTSTVIKWQTTQDLASNKTSIEVKSTIARDGILISSGDEAVYCMNYTIYSRSIDGKWTKKPANAPCSNAYQSISQKLDGLNLTLERIDKCPDNGNCTGERYYVLKGRPAGSDYASAIRNATASDIQTAFGERIKSYAEALDMANSTELAAGSGLVYTIWINSETGFIDKYVRETKFKAISSGLPAEKIGGFTLERNSTEVLRFSEINSPVEIELPKEALE